MQLCILHTAINNTENMIQMYLGFLINSEYCDKETAKKILNFSEIRNSPEFPGSIAELCRSFIVQGFMYFSLNTGIGRKNETKLYIFTFITNSLGHIKSVN